MAPQLVTVPGFVGPTNVLRSVNADVERTINWYAEGTAPGSGKVAAYFNGTPGLHVAQILTDSPVRALFTQDGRTFAVAGSSFYELTSATASTYYGSVASDSNLATIVSNGSAGNQLLITSGGHGYTFNLTTNTLAIIADADFPTNVVMAEFMDGYGLVTKANTRAFYWSALEDFTSWDPLDVAERSEASDNIVAMVRSHRELWFLGSLTSEVWYDDGSTPFAPIQGVFIEQGCSAAFTAQRIDNAIMWVGANADGFGVVWKANGYTPERVSSHAVELALQTYGVSGARAWVYQEDGHLFYVLMQPTAPTAQVYDVASGIWHERASWDSTHCVWLQPRAQVHTYAFGVHLVGDRSSGAVYQQSLAFYDEQTVS